MPATTCSRSARFPKRIGERFGPRTPLEPVNDEIKRRTRVVGVFPNDAAVLRLVSAVVAETHDEWQDTERRYLAEHTMNLLYEPASDPLDTKEVMPATIAS